MNEVGEWIWIVAFWYGFIRTWHGDLAAAEVELASGVRRARVDR